MSRCIPARTARIQLRNKKRPGPGRRVNIVFPAKWSRSTLLAYVRAEHPDETVRIVWWRQVTDTAEPWEPLLWLANPDGFADYRAGKARA